MKTFAVREPKGEPVATPSICSQRCPLNWKSWCFVQPSKHQLFQFSSWTNWRSCHALSLRPSYGECFQVLCQSHADNNSKHATMLIRAHRLSSSPDLFADEGNNLRSLSWYDFPVFILAGTPTSSSLTTLTSTTGEKNFQYLLKSNLSRALLRCVLIKLTCSHPHRHSNLIHVK